MYLHQVIETALMTRDTLLKKEGHIPGRKEEYDEFFSGILRNLSSCAPYHFEDIETIKNMTNRAGEFFTGEYGKDIRLPFRNCWFDFLCTTLPGFSAAGILAAEIEDTSIFVEMWLRTTSGIWAPSPCTAFIGFGQQLDASIRENQLKNFQGKEKIEIIELSPNVILSRGADINSKTFDASRSRDRAEAIYSLRCFNACLLLLSCKNIKTETVSAPTKLNKKRRKKGKPEIRDHNILRMVLPGKTKAGGAGRGGGASTRKPAFCHGHFKVYTPDAPLFGRLVGRYWWEPHIRGGEDASKKQRIVIPRKNS